MYHLAIHFPSEPEFARVLARLIERGQPIAPTDHVMSMEVIDDQGRMRSGRDPLDVDEVLAALPNRDIERPVPDGTTIGHVHLHVGDLDAALRFYRDDIGFIEHMLAPQFGMADLHAGGRFEHRMAINVWQGRGVTQPPPGTAGLRHFIIRLDSPERLTSVLNRIPEATRDDTGYRVHDPSGNAMLLTA